MFFIPFLVSLINLEKPIIHYCFYKYEYESLYKYSIPEMVNTCKFLSSGKRTQTLCYYLSLGVYNFILI